MSNYEISEFCAYCGETADTMDHVIPRAFIETGSRSKAKRPELGFVVPACRQCNSLLGDRIFRNFVERKAWLYKRLRRKLEKCTNVAFWDTDEMAEMGPVMRAKIESSMAKHEIAWDRLDYARELPASRWLRRESRWRDKMDRMNGDLIANESRCNDWQDSDELVNESDELAYCGVSDALSDPNMDDLLHDIRKKR